MSAVKKKKTKPTSAETATSPGVEVNIRGKIWVLRRLALSDTFPIMRMVREIFGQGLVQTSYRVRDFKDIFTTDGLNTVLLMGLPAAENEVLQFLAYMLSNKHDTVTLFDLQDPDKFPMESIFDIVEAVGKHPELQAFFAKSPALGRALSEGWHAAISLVFPNYQQIQKDLSEHSTGSAQQPAGQTTT